MTYKIAYFFEHPTLSGGERSFLEAINNLDRKRFEPIAICPESGLLHDELKRRNIHMIFHSMAQQKKPDASHFKDIPMELASKISGLNINLIHANSLSTSCYSGAIGSFLNIPSIGHIREIQKLSTACKNRLSCNTILIAVSKAAAESLISQGIAKEKVRVVHNSINSDLFCSDPECPSKTFRSEIAANPDTPLIGFVGQICIRKGIDSFLKAAAVVAKDFNDAKFIIIGRRFSRKAESMQLEEDLHEMANSKTLKGRVIFTGYRNDVPRIMKYLDLLVLPARQDPFPRVILEAMATGLPVVATNVG
ncbi:MAG: glycosyltransferase, partial [Candidatus Theseobacter exili]|nr:glycosyltransferase [Candidatus Theseobacter exili]